MREDLIYEVQRMFHQRCMYWQKMARRCIADGSRTSAVNAQIRADAYKSACDILLAAVQGNEEILKEFDYYAD